jgi:hypothetical protein
MKHGAVPYSTWVVETLTMSREYPSGFPFDVLSFSGIAYRS